MRNLLFAAGLLIVCSQEAAHAFDPKQIKAEVGMAFVASRWLNVSPGLVQWPESRYYQTNLETRFAFNRVLLFHPSLRLRYGKFSVAYAYLSNSLPLELNSGAYRSDLREISGAPIHPVRGHTFREHRFTLSYDLPDSRFAVFVEAVLAKRGIAGGYEDTIYEIHPFFSFSFFEKQTGLGLGLNVQQQLSNTAFILLGRLSVAPYTNGTYTFQRSLSAFEQRKISGWNASLQTGFGYQIGSLTTRLTYNLQTYRTYDRAIRDTFDNFELGASFSF